MRKFILNILVLVAIAGVGVLAAWFFRNCGGSRTEIGPEDTVKAFYSSLLSGDWEAADNLCTDEDGIQTYCEDFQEAWEEFSVTDSLSMSTAVAILSDAQMAVGHAKKEGKNKAVAQVTITAGDGLSRIREVELVKEEDVWLVNSVERIR